MHHNSVTGLMALLDTASQLMLTMTPQHRASQALLGGALLMNPWLLDLRQQLDDQLLSREQSVTGPSARPLSLVSSAPAD